LSHSQHLAGLTRRTGVAAMSLLQSRTRSAAEGFGKPVRRVEDARLIIGNGRFSDDFSVPGQAYACFVRSPHAHARLVRIDAAAVSVEYEPLPIVISAAQATAPGAPLVWEAAGSNVCVDSDCGDAAAADAAFVRAAHVVRLETRVNRVTGVPMEPRAALAVYDAERDHYTLYAGSGGSQRIKHDLTETLGVPRGAVRVVAREVGGNYGTRNAFYPEFALVPWAARRVGRPVKWTCERREALLTDFHARDLVP